MTISPGRIPSMGARWQTTPPLDPPASGGRIDAPSPFSGGAEAPSAFGGGAEAPSPLGGGAGVGDAIVATSHRVAPAITQTFVPARTHVGPASCSDASWLACTTTSPQFT